jgi:CheY-like chemotaxis protein
MNTVGRILVVEDNEDDTFFMQRALRTAAPGAVCDFVADGQAALDYLRATGPFASRASQPLPDVVFLDLKLPYVFGLEVLATIRSTPSLATLPVIVLTSSGEERDRTAAAQLGIVAYLVKPPNAVVIAETLTKVPAPQKRPASGQNPAAHNLAPTASMSAAS